MSSNMKYIDLDAVDPNANEVVIKLGGEEHKLVPITVEDFITNTKLVQSLGTSTDIEKEFEIVINMLCRSFPTIKEDQFRKLPLEKLNRILEIARANNGEEEVKKEAEAEAQENPPTTE